MFLSRKQYSTTVIVQATTLLPPIFLGLVNFFYWEFGLPSPFSWNPCLSHSLPCSRATGYMIIVSLQKGLAGFSLLYLFSSGYRSWLPEGNLELQAIVYICYAYNNLFKNKWVFTHWDESRYDIKLQNYFYSMTEIRDKLRFKTFSWKQRVIQLNKELRPLGGRWVTTAVVSTWVFI